jgi:hypothetical protein
MLHNPLTEPIIQETPRKPVTVNWRDIRATIQQTTLSVNENANPQVVSEDLDSDSEGKSSEINTPSDPVEDPLKWLDDGLPELFGYNHREFDLALQFDIRRYVDILADSVSDPRKTSDGRLGRETAEMTHTKLKETAADTLAPADEEWGRWE